MREALAPRLGRWWLLAGPLAVLAWTAGAPGERSLIVLDLALGLAGIALTARRALLAHAAAGSLVAANLCLAARLLGDAFAYHHVWLYSAPELPDYLKLANVWGGDEGTLLLLAALLPLAALHLGAMLALIGGTAATVFDSYAQKMVRYPDDFGHPLALPDGHTLTVWPFAATSRIAL